MSSTSVAPIAIGVAPAATTPECKHVEDVIDANHAVTGHVAGASVVLEIKRPWTSHDNFGALRRRGKPAHSVLTCQDSLAHRP